MSGTWAQRWLRVDCCSAADVRLDWTWLLALFVVLVATGIGLRDPWPADEPRFALIARDMLASGEWFVPRVAGDVYADKPPLYFWLMAAWMHVTGSMRAAFLLPSLIASLGCLVLVYDLARRLWNRHTALIAGTLLLLTVQFVWQARQAQIDATLCFWTTLSLYALLRHLVLGPRWGWYVVGWAAAGLGVLTKGVGFLPLLIIVPWWVLRKRWAVPVLTSEVTPGEPTFKDRPGTAHDEVQVPTNIAGVAYYVDGELVDAPNGKAAVTGDVTVTAVPTAWYRLADGAASEWSASFED